METSSVSVRKMQTPPLFLTGFIEPPAVCSGKTLTRHQAGLIDVGLFGEKLKAEAKTRQEKTGWGSV